MKIWKPLTKSDENHRVDVLNMIMNCSLLDVITDFYKVKCSKSQHADDMLKQYDKNACRYQSDVRVSPQQNVHVDMHGVREVSLHLKCIKDTT